MDENIKTISKRDLDSFVDALIKNNEFDVVGVKSKGKSFVYDNLENSKELRLDYDTTILPPKKYFLPQYEDMMKYDLRKPFDVEESKDFKSRVIIGMHPYDIIAVEQMDEVYFDSQQDDFYKKRRENTIIIGVDIENVYKRCFAASMQTHLTDSGFDLLLTNIGRKYAVTIGSKKGLKLLNKYAKTKNAKESDIKKIEKAHEEIVEEFESGVLIDKRDWPGVLSSNYENDFWKKQSEKCIECSSCTMVCPTCYCYDVRDEVSLDLKDGKRIRTWDGCLIRDFTRVAGDEVFRDELEARYRHRFFRKGNYLPMRYGFVACVGCGRCSRACLPDIADPCKVMNNFSDTEKSDVAEDKFFIKKKSHEHDKGIIHVPRSATLKNKHKLAENETLFEFELDDGESLGHHPGQFVEVSIFGIGEAPISISSPPEKDATFELAVRRVGDVTTALFNMESGDKVGIRGPFGNGFDLENLEKKHILFTAAGIGIFPLRSLIKHVLKPENRKDFKDITILYGCKRPCEVMFMDEIEEWRKIDDVRIELTVDRCPEGECWGGCTGLITDLFPMIHLDKYDSINTIAIVVGPPIVYKFVIKCFKTLDIPDENIWVSLERRMKCGVGKCGHCQINGVYVCKEGPVFNYADVKELPEAFE
jgi:sulfite reductase subunit B